MENRYRGCIFDLDGTLANTLSSIAYFGNGALRQFGLPTIDTEEYKLLVGNGADVLIARMAAHVGAQLNEQELAALRAEYDRRYESEPLKLVTPYPGITSLLKTLNARGIKTGVVSNKPDNMTRYIVKELFGRSVDLAHGQRPGIPKKPDPAAVLETAEAFGLSPKEVLYVGDSGVDMETGRNAGMDACGVLWGFRGKEELLSHGAVYLAEDAPSLLSILLSGGVKEPNGQPCPH